MTSLFDIDWQTTKILPRSLSPRSVTALQLCGLTPESLSLKSKQAIQKETKSRDPEVIETCLEYYKQARVENIERVLAARAQLEEVDVHGGRPAGLQAATAEISLRAEIQKSILRDAAAENARLRRAEMIEREARRLEEKEEHRKEAEKIRKARAEEKLAEMKRRLEEKAQRGKEILEEAKRIKEESTRAIEKRMSANPKRSVDPKRSLDQKRSVDSAKGISNKIRADSKAFAETKTRMYPTRVADPSVHTDFSNPRPRSRSVIPSTVNDDAKIQAARLRAELAAEQRLRSAEAHLAKVSNRVSEFKSSKVEQRRAASAARTSKFARSSHAISAVRVKSSKAAQSLEQRLESRNLVLEQRREAQSLARREAKKSAVFSDLARNSKIEARRREEEQKRLAAEEAFEEKKKRAENLILAKAEVKAILMGLNPNGTRPNSQSPLIAKAEILKSLKEERTKERLRLAELARIEDPRERHRLARLHAAERLKAKENALAWTLGTATQYADAHGERV